MYPTCGGVMILTYLNEFCVAGIEEHLFQVLMLCELEFQHRFHLQAVMENKGRVTSDASIGGQVGGREGRTLETWTCDQSDRTAVLCRCASSKATSGFGPLVRIRSAICGCPSRNCPKSQHVSTPHSLPHNSIHEKKAHLERLKEMFARRIPFPVVHHFVG